MGHAKSSQTITIPVDSGQLIVLHVEETNSTVLITDTEKELFAGALIRTPLLTVDTHCRLLAVKAHPKLGALFLLFLLLPKLSDSNFGVYGEALGSAVRMGRRKTTEVSADAPGVSITSSQAAAAVSVVERCLPGLSGTI